MSEIEAKIPSVYDRRPAFKNSALSRIYRTCDLSALGRNYVRIAAEGKHEAAKNYIVMRVRENSGRIVVGWRGWAAAAAMKVLSNASYELLTLGIPVAWVLDEVALPEKDDTIVPVSIAIIVRQDEMPLSFDSLL